MCSVLHHVEICVGEEKKLISLLLSGFGFTVIGQRVTPLSLKWVLRHGSATFVITKRRKDSKHQPVNDYMNSTQEKCVHSGSDTDPEHWTVFCCQDQSSHNLDSVFNVALEVKDVDEVARRVKNRGGRVLREPTNIKDSRGQVRYSIVTSCLGNVVHTLIDRKNYSGDFLPGFVSLGKNYSESLLADLENGSHMESIPICCDISSLENTRNGEAFEGRDILNHSAVDNACGGGQAVFTHVDHIAYVCEVGKSQKLMEWYEYCLGMKRFMTNREESEVEGLVLDGEIGMRLKAMEYWRCAEVGLAVPSATLEDSLLKLVIAEPLKGFENSQINSFLGAHKGPGVQHIALHTPHMATTVKYVSQHGVTLRKAPPTYYQKGIKLEEIKATGHENELDLFQELGILLDTEDDVFSDMKDGQGNRRYLLQVFTTPVFQEDTFFLEVIQRRGAQGFGVGNISALARSIILHQQQQQNKVRQPCSS